MNKDMSATLVVNEIFKSIQGESTYSGLPCSFIRLTGCNLRCSYCDTTYAYTEGTPLSVETILNRVEALGVPLVEITGGEPLMQKETSLLAQRLLSAGYTVLVETNGSMNIDGVPPGVIRIVDVKCPASNEQESFDMHNIDRLTSKDECKFVVENRADFNWASVFISQNQLAKRCTVIFSPIFGSCKPADLANWILESGLNIRLGMQLHKYIWLPQTRGV